MSRKLIVISGPSASGKSTVSLRLSKELDVPLLAKDDIKEMLFERLPQRDREWSRVQGRMAITMMFAGARELLLQDSPVMIESLFHPEYARADIQQLVTDTGADVYEIQCHVAHEERQRRWIDRSTNARHPGHLDDPMAVLENKNDEAPLFPENASVIDTGAPNDVYERKYKEAVSHLMEWLKGDSNESAN